MNEVGYQIPEKRTARSGGSQGQIPQDYGKPTGARLPQDYFANAQIMPEGGTGFQPVSTQPVGGFTTTANPESAQYDPRNNPFTKQWNQWNYTGDYGITSPQDAWYRNASWAPHNIWNEQYGFQNIGDVEKLYGAGGDLSSLTPQMAASFAGSKPKDHPTRGGGGVGTNYSGNWMDYFTQPQGTQAQGWTEGFTMPESQPFPYPEQWNTASNVFTNFAEGLPTSTDAWWEAQQAPFERTISDQVKQMAEQMGLGGLRYSTPMTHQIADITGREAGNLYGNLATQQLGLTEAAKDRGMQAAGALTGLGQQYLNAPQDWAQRMYGMGAGMTGLGQQGLDRAYQDWMRMTPEYNPYFAQAMGFGGMQSQMTPQQYQPSFLSQLFGALAGGAGMAGGLGWSPFG